MGVVVNETTETSPRIAHARHLEGCRMEVAVRGFPPFVADEPPHHGGTDGGPTPLEYVTAGLAACQTVTVAKLADAMRFRYRSLEVHGETVVGFVPSQLKSGPVPRFTGVKLRVDLVTDEPAERVERLKELVEERCPASRLFTDAGLPPEVDWNVKAP